MYEEEGGRHIIRTGVKVSSYLSPFAKKTEGIIGQPEPQYYYHRPIHVLFKACFAAGFVMDGIEEPGFPVRLRDRGDLFPGFQMVEVKAVGVLVIDRDRGDRNLSRVPTPVESGRSSASASVAGRSAQED